MNLLKKNIAANFARGIWQAIIGIIFVPLYIKFMGVESYGLVGIFATLQSMFFLLDMGLSSTLNRELARLSVLPGSEQEMRNLVRSVEIIFWCVALIIGIIVIGLSPFLAHQWFKTDKLAPQTIEQAIQIMGFALALQWPASIYTGGFMGLQKQVLLSYINIAMSTFRGVGAVLILWLISPTVQYYFLWQMISSFLTTGILAFYLWKILPIANERTNFQKELLSRIWRFAAGMSGISISAIILTQLDKIILSKMLTLEMFGYYSLAGVLTSSLYRLISPLFSALYPRFTQLISLSHLDELKQLYHKSCQFLAVMLFSVSSIIALFSYEILLIWTQNPLTAEKAHILVSILICGTALNGLMNIPYALQLANGWVKLTLYVNLVSIFLLVPLIVYMTTHYGAIGGASVWVILNVGYVLISIQFMHRRLLKTEKWNWYLKDVSIPLVVSLVIAGIGKLLMQNQMSQYEIITYILIISFFTLGITAISTETTRNWIYEKMLSLKT